MLESTFIYLTNTRPDITCVVQHLSQFVANPTSAHQQVAFRILWYIKGSPSAGIFLSADNNIYLKGFSDSNWADYIDTRIFITSYAIYLGNSFISWKSKKQATASISSLKVEYKALASAISELRWLTFLLQEFKIGFHQPIVLYCDNQSAWENKTHWDWLSSNSGEDA